MAAKKAKFETFQSKSGRREWFWRLRSRNGRIVAVSGEGYTRKSKAEFAILVTMRIVEQVIYTP